MEYLNEQEEMEDNQMAEEEERPEFGEVDGQVIRLGGLDYNLLKEGKESEASAKRNLLDALKNKINIISGNVLDRIDETTHEEKVQLNDKFLKGLMKVHEEKSNASLYGNENRKSEVYFDFDLDDFGRKMPTILEKRIGKMSNKPQFVHFEDTFLKELSQLTMIKEGLSTNARKTFGQIVNNVNDDDDDEELFEEFSIFGNDSDDDRKEEKQERSAKKNTQVDIQIGKTLNFGINDSEISEIFAPKRSRPTEEPMETEPTAETDKYFFMRHKKVKNNVIEDDGYGECYHQSGPSLQELVDYKKQGIEFYGDLKEFKQREKKAPNINKEYNMIQKIIEKKKKE